jgi:DUF4097 and DUF4098 domain-containing protein YvlB
MFRLLYPRGKSRNPIFKNKKPGHLTLGGWAGWLKDKIFNRSRNKKKSSSIITTSTKITQLKIETYKKYNNNNNNNNNKPQTISSLTDLSLRIRSSSFKISIQTL